MRRAATLLVVAGLIFLVGLAAVEALRGDDAGEADPGRGSTQPGLPDRLEEAGVAGLLYLSTRRGAECAIQAVRLPSLAVESEVPAPDCRFAVAPNGSLATGFDCDEPGTLMRPDGAIVDRFDGCAPAWKPSGELTFVRAGNVMHVPRSCDRTIDACASVALSRQDVRGAFAELGQDPPSQETVREIEWLDNSRAGVVVRRSVGAGEDPLDFVVAFEGRAFLGPLGFITGRVTDLAVDRPGRRFYASADVVRGLAQLDDRGRPVNTVTLPQGIPEASSVAFSPDGTWAAATAGDFVVLFRPRGPPDSAFELPFTAESVAWREP
ncbi:MAG: hypothetical protein ACRDNI_03655 [Gaiellaceae bacterium]